MASVWYQREFIDTESIKTKHPHALFGSSPTRLFQGGDVLRKTIQFNWVLLSINY